MIAEATLRSSAAAEDSLAFREALRSSVRRPSEGERQWLRLRE
jgi:hypothetical protein